MLWDRVSQQLKTHAVVAMDRGILAKVLETSGYELCEQIGAGGTATVHRCTSLSTGESYA